MLLPSTAKDKRWDIKLRRIQWTLNTTMDKITGKTPQEFVYEFKPRDVLQNKLGFALHNRDVIDVENSEVN